MLTQSWAHSGAGTLPAPVPGTLSRDSVLCAEVPSREVWSVPSWTPGLPCPILPFTVILTLSPALGVAASPHFPLLLPFLFLLPVTKNLHLKSHLGG